MKTAKQTANKLVCGEPNAFPKSQASSSGEGLGWVTGYSALKWSCRLV